jgi:hypothetical protein
MVTGDQLYQFTSVASPYRWRHLAIIAEALTVSRERSVPGWHIFARVCAPIMQSTSSWRTTPGFLAINANVLLLDK